MKILITGASGLVGTAATNAFRAEGHTVGRFVRPGGNFAPGDVRWDPAASLVYPEAMEGADAILHLAGANIGEGRWTDERKAVLRSSRLESTRILVDAIGKLQRKPRALLAASAIGYYGNRGDEVLTESSSNGSDFLAKLTREWETESLRAQSFGIRTVLLRFGMILSAHSGALSQMVKPFKLGLGGRVGSGKQWMSWIAIDDVVGAIRVALANDNLSGPLNVVAPNPVRNAEFTRVLAAAVHRPALFPAPPFMLRLAFGQMADDILLASQRVQPQKLLDANFSFRYPDLPSALHATLSGVGN